jgi:hypothetical protein
MNVAQKMHAKIKEIAPIHLEDILVIVTGVLLEKTVHSISTNVSIINFARIMELAIT